MKAQHTPDCTCKADSLQIYFCPLHAAAPKLLEALKEVISILIAYENKMTPSTQSILKRIQLICAEAEGR